MEDRADGARDEQAGGEDEAGQRREPPHEPHRAQSDGQRDPRGQQCPHDHLADGVDIGARADEEVTPPHGGDGLHGRVREPQVHLLAKGCHAAESHVVGQQPLHVPQHGPGDPEGPHPYGGDGQVEHRGHLGRARDQPRGCRGEADRGPKSEGAHGHREDHTPPVEVEEP